MTYGTILAYYNKFLMPEVSKALLCTMGGIPGFMLLFLALLWGRLLDAGYHRKLNLLAGIMLATGWTGLAFTGGKGRYGDGKPWAILLACFPIGIAQSVYFLTAPHVARSWFAKNPGLAMGITNSGAALGKLILAGTHPVR